MANGGSQIGINVLLDEIDDSIQQLKNNAEKKPTPLCAIHEQSLITLLRCEKHRLMHTRKIAVWSTIAGLASGSVATIIYAVAKALG